MPVFERQGFSKPRVSLGYTARPPIFRNIKGVFYIKSVHSLEIKFNLDS